MAADWKAIKTEYITTNISHRKLAEKYGVHATRISTTASKEGWSAERERYRSKVLAKSVDAIGNAQAQRAARLQSVADKLLAKIEAAVDNFDMEMLFMDKQALRQITGAIKDIKDIQMIKSDADIREQEARINKLNKEAEKDEAKSNDVTIRIVGGAEEWQE